MKLSRPILIALLTVMIVGCAQPLPPEKQAYVGEWRGEYVTLIIDAGGHVDYSYAKGNVTRSISAPLKHFEGDDFVVGVGPLATTFEVSIGPHDVDGVWTMVVDGMELTRVADANLCAKPIRPVYCGS